MHGLLHRHDANGTCLAVIQRCRPHHHHARSLLTGASSLSLSQRFRDEGCPNCEDFLRLQNSPEQIESCTSQVFEGLITLADPSKSWVAKWQRLDGYVKGVYAIKVSGQLPDDIRVAIEDETGMQYIPRDGSATEADV
ncbi:hypothetical protein RB594_009110 [Gaeumannomyces avenae]